MMKIRLFLGVKNGKAFWTFDRRKKSLRNVKHRSGILSTRSTISDHPKNISLLTYSPKMKKKVNKLQQKMKISKI